MTKGGRRRRRITNIPNTSRVNITNTAEKLGFDNIRHFEDFIKNINPHHLSPPKVRKLTKIFKYLSKSKGTIAKSAIAGGTLLSMIIYMKHFQKKYSGCFRYDDNDDDKTIKYKFKEICGNDDDDDDDDDDVKLLPIQEHPLYGIKKWDYNYYKFEKGNKEIDEILQLGCNGLCDWKNFNILAETTQGKYDPINPPANDKYVYNCETMSLLKALSTSTGNAVNEIVTGLYISNLGKNITNFFFRLLIIFITILMIIIILHKKKMRDIKKGI